MTTKTAKLPEIQSINYFIDNQWEELNRHNLHGTVIETVTCTDENMRNLHDSQHDNILYGEVYRYSKYVPETNNKTELVMNGQKLEFNCSSGIENNGNGDYFDTTPNDSSCESMGETALCKLAYMLINGYPKCYDDIGNYMIDWSMDLPWTEKQRVISQNHMKAHKHFSVIFDEFNKQFPNCELI